MFSGTSLPRRADIFEFVSQVGTLIKTFGEGIDQVSRAAPDSMRMAQISSVGSRAAPVLVADVGRGEEVGPSWCLV